MSMTRTGCGDNEAILLEGDDRERCERCGFAPLTSCTCTPCDDCATLVDSALLTWAADGRWRCAACHLRADVKLLCAERPAFRPAVADVYVAMWSAMAVKP